MKSYKVKVPIMGYLEVDVEGANEQSAMNSAVAKALNTDITEIIDWDVYKQIIRCMECIVEEQ